MTKPNSTTTTIIPAAPGFSVATWTLYTWIIGGDKNKTERRGQFDYLPIIAWCVTTVPDEDGYGVDVISHPVTQCGWAEDTYVDVPCYIVKHGSGEEDDDTFTSFFGSHIGNLDKAWGHAEAWQARLDAVKKMIADKKAKAKAKTAAAKTKTAAATEAEKIEWAKDAARYKKELAAHLSESAS